MAKLDIRGLNYITASSKQGTLNIDFAYTDDGHIQASAQRKPKNLGLVKRRTFFTDVGEEESMSQKYKTNMASLYDISSQIIIHNIYDLTKTKLKSSIKKSINNSQTLDLYNPMISTDFLDMCQFETYSYALSERTNISPTFLSVIFNDKTLVDYSYIYQFNCEGINTNMYRPLFYGGQYDDFATGTIQKIVEDSSLLDSVKSSIKSYTGYVLSGGPIELSSSRVKQVFDAVRKMSNIKYNYLVELPEAKDYNNYSDGKIFCNTFICKNDLDYLYTMNIENDCHHLCCCRDYVGLGTCGGKMFMKYRTNVQYYSLASEQHLIDSINNDVLQRDMHEMDRERYSYQHVEVVESLNRYDNQSSGHKSSLYSICLHDTGLNTTSISEVVKSRLRQNITNNIRTMASKICPANTQLFNVYFEGK